MPKRWRSLSSRIVALFLGLLLLVQAASFTAIGASIDANARALVAEELQIGERMLHRLVAQNADKLIQGATLLAADYGFRAAASTADEETIASALANQGERIGASVAALLDTDFKLRSRAREAGDMRPVIAQLAPRANAGEPASVVMALGDKPYQFVLAPVRAPVVIGWVLMGFPIDRALADDLRNLSSVQVAVLARAGADAPWRVAVATLDGADDIAAMPAAASYVAMDGGEYGARRTALSQPGASGEVVAVLLRSVDEAVAPYRELQWSLALLTVIGLLVFAFGSVVTARRVTTPLTQLVRAAQRLGGGDYDTPPAGIERRDEIGGLAKAFDQMRVSVAHHQREALRLAYWDSLTGLPNRVQFGQLVERAIERAQNSGGSLAVIMLDLDRFKHVNDVLGYTPSATRC